MSKGANLPVPTAALRAVLRHRPGAGVPDLDASALLLAADGKVRSDADFVFYNAPVHGSGAVRHEGKDRAAGTETLTVDLARVEPAVDRVVLAASADGGSFGQVPGLALALLDGNGAAVAEFEIGDATTETAFVFGELYRRGDAWKIRAVGQGWASGLAGLATDFGISVDDEPAPAPAAAPASGISLKKQKQISLEKRAAEQAPQLVDLVKRASVSLDKKGLGEHTARVALCLDISASMSGLYRQGKVQALLERLLALALRFDDDGAVDVFLFGAQGHEAGTLDLSNVTGYTDQVLSEFRLEGGTNYGLAMKLIRKRYFGSDQPRTSVHRDPVPVYCMFVTDGQTSDERSAVEQVKSSSFEPLFWEFIAIGPSAREVAPRPVAEPTRRGLFSRPAGSAPARSSTFRFLEELDDMPGRLVDNADFFAVADPTTIPDDELFDLMTSEYPRWLQEIAAKGMR